MTSQVMVHIRHVRAVNLCSGGTRTWFRQHDFDWDEFLTNGLPVEMFEASGDPLALRVAGAARQEAEGSHG